MGGLRTHESTEKQHDFEQLLIFVEMHHIIHRESVTDVCICMTDVRFPTFLHMTIFKLTKLKESTLFQLFSFYVKDKQQKGNNSSSFMMFMHLN